uniref:CUE domain-containing protein n=1 Tax=Romanomermis culicivorax TaxID=13658 RepID=A0A915L3P2_ROMCU
MFPSLDESLIESVLRAHRGAVDDTIDALLALSITDSADGIKLRPKNEQKICAKDLLSDFLTSDAQAQKFKKKIYEPPLLGELPPDFLRLNFNESNKFHGSHKFRPKNDDDFEEIGRISSSFDDRGSSRTLVQSTTNKCGLSPGGVFYTSSRPRAKKSPSKNDGALNLALKLQGEIFKEKMAENDWKRHLNNDPELEQYLEDERIALMLQNEEFLLHLENDPDFLAALEKGGDELIDEADPFPYTKILPKIESNDLPFSEKLKFMGKNSKRKFAILARKFNYKKKGAKAIIGDNQSNYVDVGLLGGAYLNDESDLLIDEQENFGAGASSSAGYNQREDDNYNISHRTDLKEGRLFSTYKS